MVELQDHVFADDASDVLDRYLNNERYSGAWFEKLGGPGDAPEIADQFTTVAIVAVSTLSVNVSGWAAIELLDRRAREFGQLLAKVPNGLELADASDEALTAVAPVKMAPQGVYVAGCRGR